MFYAIISESHFDNDYIIIGYVTDEVKANQITNDLNSKGHKYENHSFYYQPVDEFNDIEASKYTR